MKLRTLKHRHLARMLRRRCIVMLYDETGDDDWCDEHDYSGGPVCGSCGAGVDALYSAECWACGEEL